ncbi:MAG TPA: TQO small subunit DoxD [Ktedonobacteraceae bacterium]|nr:TQO small subunit DoxD [Ktedonobacteraceae bacterium]
MKQTGNRNIKGGAAQPPAYTQPPINTNNPGATIDSSPWWTKVHPLEWALLPLRLFLGVTFVYAGIQKLTDPQFFNPRAIGYIGKQIIGFANGSPIHNFLISLVPHAHFFGVLIILGEIAIGLGVLFGFLFRPAAFFGMLLSLMFFLSASWHVYPYFYGADIVFVFAWLTMLLAGPLHSALPSLDGLLVPRYLSTLSPQSQVILGRISQVLLGVGNQGVIGYTGQTAPFPLQGAYPPGVQGGMPGTPQSPVYNSRVSGYPQGVPYQVMNNRGAQYQPGMSQQQRQPSYKAQIAAQRQSLESRRKFLWGLVAGGLGMLGITLAAKVLNVGGDDAATGGSSDSGAQSTPSTGNGTPSGGGSSNAIAQVSAVPENSAVTFTIPSNGDPGVLVHLNNGKFVCFDATCTHAGCPVSYDPGSKLLLCPCHGAEFDPANNAAAVAGPTSTPLTSVPININNSTGAITLQ